MQYIVYDRPHSCRSSSPRLAARASSVRAKTALNLVRLVLTGTRLVLDRRLLGRRNASLLSDRAAAPVLVGLEVADEQVAVLVVAVGRDAGLGAVHDVEDAGGVAEDVVHFLEGAVGCLGLVCRSASGCNVNGWVEGGLRRRSRSLGR